MGGRSLLDKWALFQAVIGALDLSPLAKIALGRLLYHHNTTTGRCSPSYQTLADGIGVKRRAAIYAVQDLERAGWLTVDRVKGGDPNARGGFVTNGFRLNFERVGGAPPVHDDALPPGARPCTPPGAPNGTTPVHGGALPPVHGGAPKHGKENTGKEGKSLSFDPHLFDRFWQAYPRRVGKDAAKAAFAKVLEKGRATADELIAGAERYAAERSTQDPTYTKHPTTWLNGGHWADEPARPQRPRGGALQHVLNGGYFDE